MCTTNISIVALGTKRMVNFTGAGEPLLTLNPKVLVENKWNGLMKRKHLFLSSLETTDNMGVNLSLWLLSLVGWQHGRQDGTFFRL